MDGSHPKEKYEFGVTDPTPKRNLVKEPGSHPEENLGWENRKAKDTEVGQQTAGGPGQEGGVGGGGGGGWAGRGWAKQG